MRLMVGCPVSHRDWILPLWHEHVVKAAEGVTDDLKFIFLASPDDTETIRVCEEITPFVVKHRQPPREDVRTWNTLRYEDMKEYRNRLLKEVRQHRPDFFLSLDSDILLHPEAIKGMLEVYTDKSSKGCWAVGGKTYMTVVGRSCPSYGQWRESNHNCGIKREEYSDVLMVDVIMAIKLMSPAAYNVSYAFHHWGEDLGWSSNVRALGGKLWWDGRYVNKHVMERKQLDLIDPRCGF